MMERLTIRDDDGTIRIKREINGNTCFSNYMRSFDIEAVCRLGAYEDTGLSPERCAELAKADKDGRLLVLPCKPLDTVYSLFCGEIVEKRIGAITINGYTNPRIWVELDCDFLATQTKRWDLAVGKEFYLTREEAEQALKEAKKDG